MTYNAETKDSLRPSPTLVGGEWLERARVAQARDLAPVTIVTGPTLFAIYLPIYFYLDTGHIGRNALYLFPLLCALEVLVRSGTLRFRTAYLFLCLCFMSYALGRLAVGNLVNVKEFLFVALALLTISIAFQVRRSFAKYLLAAGVASVVLESAGSGQTVTFSLFGSSRGLAETSFGLVIPLIALVWYKERRWLWFALTLIVALAMSKRIAMVAMLVAIGLDMFTARGISRPGIRTVNSAAAALIVFTAVWLSLNSVAVFGFLSDFVRDQLGTFVSPDALSSGRYFATQVFLNEAFTDRSAFAWLFGDGPGASTRLLGEVDQLRDRHFPLLHNDFLRVLSDFGIVGLSVVIVGFFLLLRGSRLTVLFASYTLVMFMTDNVATYLLYWLSAVFLIRAFEPAPTDGRR